MFPEGPLHRQKCDTVAEYLREQLKGYAKVYRKIGFKTPSFYDGFGIMDFVGG